MIVSCLLSFAILPHGITWLHGLAAYTIYAVIGGIKDARAGNIESHKQKMLYPYIGTLVAMFFAFYADGRLLNTWLFSFFK